MKWIRLIDKPDLSTFRYERKGTTLIDVAKFDRWDVLIKCEESDIKRLDEMGIRWEIPTK